MASSLTEQYRRMYADIVAIPVARLPVDVREREGALGEWVVA